MLQLPSVVCWDRYELGIEIVGMHQVSIKIPSGLSSKK